MDLRTRTSLVCGALALAIAASSLLRGHPRKARWLFAAFAADIGLWYLAQWLYHFVRADVWARSTEILAVLMPQLALHLFEAILPRPGQPSKLLRVATVLLIPMALLVLLPRPDQPWLRVVIFVYVFGLFAAGLGSLLARGERSRSRSTQKRVRFLVVCGALAVLFSLADFLWFIGAPLPPVGAVLSMVFLFVLAESLIRERLLDHYEMLGLAVVSTTVAFALAGIFYVFVVLLGRFQTMYLNAVLGGIVMLVLFEPLRDKMQSFIHRAFFLERVDLERSLARARRELVRVIEVKEMLRVTGSALEDSRRVTRAAIFLRDPGGDHFVCEAGIAVTSGLRLAAATLGPLLQELERVGSVDFEELARERQDKRRAAVQRGAPDIRRAEDEAEEHLLATSDLLGDFRRGACLGVRSRAGEIMAFFVVADDRVNDAFSSDDLSLLSDLATQMGIVIENSREYAKLRERERLAALGQIAAGLAHEVKNPLGAIKGAAQLLSDPNDDKKLDATAREFVDIILEEVERLDRVVGSVLDYGKPPRGRPLAIDVNAVVRRTTVVLSKEHGAVSPFDLELQDDLPRVRADAEQLRQVLINLIQNAVQATEGQERVIVRTGVRSLHDGAHVAISVTDRGAGISPAVRERLFIPFFTTKEGGTGLGLAISGRVVQEMGGRIDVQSEVGAGATFTVLLPVDEQCPRVDPDASKSDSKLFDSARQAPPTDPSSSGPGAAL